MAQKFSSIEEAANQLGISKDRLNQIREAGKIRAYRDGTSWKFRQDDIDRLVRDGIPAIDPGASDIALDLGDEPALPTPTAEPSGLDLDLADEEPAGPASDVSLDDVEEPTVAGDAEMDELALDTDESSDMSDSILLSEAELGESTDRPPSTIIGRAELDADLDLKPKGQEKPAHMSDVRLAPTSDIISGGDDDLALDMEPPSPSDNFQGLEELEVDLEAESSRILSPKDVEKAQSAAKSQQAKAAPPSDLELAPSDSDAARAASDIGLGGDSAAGGTGLTGLSALELEDDQDDQVLGEGSDVTLSSESSGINIISPSDSGLALDEVPLDLSGSAAMGSSLDLGGALEEDEVELQPLGAGSDAAAESGVGGVFQLTPIGEEADDEEKDSSQVIALDEISEEAGEPIGAGFDHGVMGEEFGAVGLVPGAVIAEPTSETPFSGAVVAGLSLSLLMLALCGMMVFDLMRNIWSWDGVTTLNSSLLEVLNPML